MSETTNKPATRPAAARARKTTPAKVTAPAPEAVEETAQKVTFELEAKGTTKTFAKFEAPAGTGCVGTFYAPLGTKTVKVLLVG